MHSVLLLDKEELFNHYVSTHPCGDVLQTTWWGRLKSTSGWEYLPLGVMENGALQATALILIKRLPLNRTLLYSPRGPLYSNEDALLTLLHAGKDLAKKEKALVWKMDPAIARDDDQWMTFVEKQKLKQVDAGLDFDGVQPRFVMTLNLHSSLENLLKDMKSKTRYNIRYAKRQGVDVRSAKNKADLMVFYDLLQETALRDNFTIRPLSYFEAMWEYLVENQLAQLFLAYFEDIPLAGAIAFRLGKTVWYVYGASSNQKRNLQAPHLIQWEMIKWAKSRGCSVYDFRGVSGDLSPENPLYGLYRFKEGFGAQLREYVGEFDLPLSRGGYGLWQGGLALHNRIRNRKK